MANFANDCVLDVDPFRNIEQRIQFTIIQHDGSKSFLEFGYDTFNDCGVHWTLSNGVHLFRDNISIRDALALLGMDHGKYTLEWCENVNENINDILSYSFSGCPLCQIIINQTPPTA